MTPVSIARIHAGSTVTEEYLKDALGWRRIAQPLARALLVAF
jgi:hypothetical protein